MSKPWPASFLLLVHLGGAGVDFPHFDYHRGNVIHLRLAVGKSANCTIELVHDLGGRILSVIADNVHGPLEAEDGVVRSARLNDPITEKEDNVARLEGDRRGDGEIAVAKNSEGRASAFQQRLHIARRIEKATTRVAGTDVVEGTGLGVDSSEEEGDEIIVSDIL